MHQVRKKLVAGIVLLAAASARAEVSSEKIVGIQGRRPGLCVMIGCGDGRSSDLRATRVRGEVGRHQGAAQARGETI